MDTLHSPADIVPTIVYADNRRTVCNMANFFWNCVPEDWRSKFPFTFCDLSTGLSIERRRLVVAATQRGFCRILFATQVAEVGIDFPKIERVVQWCIPLTLSAAGLYQRFGRAARTDGMVGVGILFHTQHAVIPVNKLDHPLRCLRDSARTADTRGILRLIQAFDSGSHRKDLIATTAMECAAEVSLEDDNTQHADNQDMDIYNASSGGNSHSTEATEVPDNEQDISHVDSNISADFLNASPSDHSDDLSSASRMKRSSDKLPSLCRMLMWMVNTNGCIREAFMRYFDEAHFSTSDCEPSHNFPCCDRHTPYQDLPATFHRLVPVQQGQPEAGDELHEFHLADPDVEQTEVSSAGKRKPLNYTQKTAVVHVLQALRAKIWQELQLGGLYSPFPSYTLIPDQDIWILSTKAYIILDEPATACNTVPALRRLAGIGVTDIVPRFIVAMQLAVDSAPVSQGTRLGRPRIHSSENTLPHDVSLDADPIDPQVSGLLQANQYVRMDYTAADATRIPNQACLHHPPPLQIETQFSDQQLDRMKHHFSAASDLQSFPSEVASDHRAEPVFNPETNGNSFVYRRHLWSSRFQNDPQNENTLDPRILARLPKRGKGRPSSADKAARVHLIEQLIQEFAEAEESIVENVVAHCTA
ncbi:hypothetical protein FN846DRAFT_896210 [Sphaerosporella brunnea]|uniref:DNA 3'-5' helicase n=1 Tax=Sphaerosporella brunnea TaxID=1250544 RepID=A0A5J5EEP9_9PEZI|nr:hypothetical protein FN846DRAFT_896210 [Sphaerosporella brunnea]